MKKTLLLLMLMSIAVTSNAQTGDRTVSIGFGVATTNLEVGNASPIGFMVELDLFNFYIGAASNMARGQGEYLDFSSSKTTQADKQNWSSINFGYNVNLSENWVVLPKLGFIIINDIWEDPVGWDTYYQEHNATNFQAGIDIKRYFGPLYLKAGVATTELFSFSMGFSL